MSQSHRNIGKNFGKRYDGAIVKINTRKLLNLPKIKKQEEEFQNLIDSYESDQLQENFVKIPIRSTSKHSQQLNIEESEQKPEFELYGLSRIRSDKYCLISPKHNNRSILNKSVEESDRKDPLEQLEKCKQMNPPQAQVQFYSRITNEYKWEDVEVLDFNQELQKYIVQQYPNGKVSKVSRLQIKFYSKRKNINNNDSFVIRRSSFKVKQAVPRIQTPEIQQEKQIIVNPIFQFPLITRQKLFNKFIHSKKIKLITNLLNEVSDQYASDMMKCRSISIMKQYRQNPKTYLREVRYNTLQKSLMNNMIISNNVYKGLMNMLERCHKYQVNLFGINDLSYPLHYEELLNHYQNQEACKAEIHKNRHYIISEIQDHLTQYNFTQNELNHNYENSKLQRILRRFDLQYSYFLSELAYKESVSLITFYKQFRNQQQDNLIQPKSFLNLDGQVKIVGKDKNFRIIVVPSQEEAINILMKPITNLSDMISKQMKMEGSIMTLMLIQQKCSFDIEHSEEINNLKQECQKLIISEYQKCTIIIKQYGQFDKYLQPVNKRSKSNSFSLEAIFGITGNLRPLMSELNYESISNYLHKILDVQRQIQLLTADVIHSGLFTLNLGDFKQQLIQKAQYNFNISIKQLIGIIKLNISILQKQYEDMYTKSSVIPSKEEELIELKLFLDELQVTFSKLNLQISEMQQYFDLFENLFYSYEVEIYQNYLQLLFWPYEIMQAFSINRKAIQIQEKAFLQKLSQEKVDFVELTSKIQDLFYVIRGFHQYEQAHEQMAQTKQLSELIEEAKQITNSFNQREIMFSLQISQYSELELIYREFKPYQNLWELIEKYLNEKDHWLYSPFRKLNHQQIINRVSQFINETIAITTYFKEIKDDNAQNLTRGFRMALDEFKSNLWVVEALGIEAFQKKPSLWRDLCKECKIQNFDPKEDFPFQALLQRGILNVKEEVLALSHRAEKGWNIERRLHEMQEKLFGIEIEVLPYQETFIFKNYEEVLALLDEQLNVLSMLKSQPHIKMVLGKANQLQYKIVLIEDTLDYAMKCQKHWMYLDPIFESEDIKKKLIKETNQFKQVDTTFKQCMNQLNAEKILWECIDNEKMKIEFSGAVLMLDQIQRSLNIYLEQKRALFPRFYFLSDEELVQILAQSKDPAKLQKHIYKCFEGIHQLEFQNTHLITAMLSIQGERVSIDQAINLTTGSRQGNVEQWLSDLQVQMQLNVKKISSQTLKDLNSTTHEFISKWPGQCILLANQIKWTRNTESAIRQQQKMNLKRYLEQLNQQLQETVYLVRSEERDVQKNTLEALVVIEVHSKDIIYSLYKHDVQTIHEFQWISQLRYYDTEKGDVNLKMVNASVNYGFEYLGKITRLVITSLTDRCQRTLLGALHMHYGGAPEGPAGTGKSETVKDLAKAVAMPCIVFNCSDGLNYIAMGKFFKGLASSGAWCCFDEFNRIDPEVLSVVAQQIFTIQKAIKEDRQRFVFEGEEIALVSTCAINVTMNPGYAGRSELPDNLKILFRPCAMMVPDYAMIAEIYLYSIGFEKARELSSKIVACLKLCTEQLSSQQHYDFGMRTLKAVLNTAKLLYDGTEETICLTSLIRINKPKFLENDHQLFMAITEDLFPGVQSLSEEPIELEDVCYDLNLQLEKCFVDKCSQLQDNIKVRNGVMCLGKTFSGKSTTISALAKMNGCIIHKLNPKSVTTEQLYGKLDQDTKQWSEGVVSILIRDNLQKNQPVWIVFDGPVDSLWIENLNTVLDDNKKLCLTSGEILKIPNSMCMLFEVENIISASPATISRCGMVYYLSINWYLLVQSFGVPQGFDQDYFIRRLRFLIDNCIAWIREFASFALENYENIAVSSMLRILYTLLSKLDPNEGQTEIWDNYIVFSLVWSIGAGLEEKYRYLFNEFLHRLLRTKKSGLKTQHPEDLNISLPYYQDINYFQNVYVNEKWVNWKTLESDLELQKTMAFNEIIIPTMESIRNDYLCKMGGHYLFCGPSGTGKSLSMSKLQQFQINCSGQTTANIIQRLIETKINKRRRKGYYGSEQGQIVIFIDDLNLPYREINGAQTAIELLRQWMDQGGWYDLETKEFKFMCDITFISAMQPSKGESNQVTMRYLRYFNLLYIGGFDQQSISVMLNVFADWLFLKLSPSQEIQDLKQMLVNATIQLYEKIQLTLLPTPSKSHYIFSLKDLFRIFEGISFAQKLNSQNQMIKLWCHECQRIFGDKLIDDYDKKLLENLIKEQATLGGFHLSDISEYIWGQIQNSEYKEITNLNSLKQNLQISLEEYNSLNGQYRMNLIFFHHAMLHVVRISRILLGIYGHVLLIGMSGSGRSSLGKIANFIIHKKMPVTVDSRIWNDQLLSVLKEIGLENIQQTLLFTDTQFTEEYMLDDVCNIMSHGEVPHLFPPEERIKIQEELEFPEFVKNCKLNIHLILCMQPIGASFRKRLRSNPKLINCSTIDWFMGWPEEALEQTGQQFLPKLSLIKVAMHIHSRILEINQRYQQELRRFFYVTPTQYLQMLHNYSLIYEQKSEDGRIQIDKFETGIEKIIETEQNVERIRQVLFDLQPKLEKATNENQELLRIIKKKQKEADLKKQTCEAEEAECQEQREQANYLRNECQKELDNVLPLLDQATEALEKINREDMILLKSFTNPPASAAIVMEGLCYTFQEDENVKTKNKDGPQTQDYWDYAKRYLLNDKLIKRIKKMKIEEIRSINPTKIAKLQVFVQNPLFEREKVFNASSAAGNLAQWIRAVLSTYVAVEIIEPKKAELNLAESKLGLAEQQLNVKREALQQSLSVLDKLSGEYAIAKEEKEKIEAQVKRIQAQLVRAEKLIFGLGEEKERWNKTAIKFKTSQLNIEGDCLLGAATISYLGVFPVQYRDLCLMEWKKNLRQYLINFTENYQIQVHLCDPITINTWVQQKLPNDSFSIDNAIILKKSIRWPLMIDPQIQANQWIKNMEDAKSLLVLNATLPAQQMQLPLEHALQIGYAVILENVGETIHPLFSPILQFRSTSLANRGQIKFGDKLIEISSDFRFYMTTKLNNPHYPPQICLMVTMLNFQVTLEGLSDQMLNIIVKMDEPSKEEQRVKNIQLFFLYKNRQQETEQQILKLLSEAVGDLLEDEVLIDTLQKSKEEAIEIEETLKKLQYDSQVFLKIRDFYTQAAESVANLYFVVNDLSMVEPTYQWSLEFYILLYKKSIKEAPYGRQKRIQNIIERFKHNLYVTINRSLLEKDKTIFRLLLCLRVLDIPTLQIRSCVMGPTLTESSIDAPKYNWMNKYMWLYIVDVSKKFPSIFGWLIEDFHQNYQFWESVYQSPQPYKQQIYNLSQYHITMIIKIIKPDQFIQAVNYLIQITLGKQFLENIPQTFDAFFQESTQFNPLLCIVTPGADPRQDIVNLAEKYQLSEKFNQLSLGQGQVQQAIRLLKIAMHQGRWILLQNCHVAQSFMPELEQIYETLNKRDIHKEFRLWLTTLPTNLVPHNVILRSIKLTYELPRGLKNNMLRSYYLWDNDSFEKSSKSQQWKNLFYSITLFHAVVLERRKFGPIGWNIPYSFSQHDLEISKEQIKYFLENSNEIPWDALQYLISETNYGGRVTDPEDRKLLNVLLMDFLNPRVLNEVHVFSPGYVMPPCTSIRGYIEYIQSLPLNDPTSLFGMHPNAEIYSSILETKQVSNVILQLLPRSIGSNTQNPDAIIRVKCTQLLSQLPNLFEIEEIQKQHQMISNSLTNVLLQELIRYNHLLSIINKSLQELQRGLDGHIHITDEQQLVYNQLFDNLVPDIWSKFSYPSNKKLGSWIIDLVERLKFIQSWVVDGIPKLFWLGGFFFIQGFLTGQLQNYSRKYKIAIDQIDFEYQYFKDIQNITLKDGFIVYKLYIDGARFDFNTNSLEEPDFNILYYESPYIAFIPTIQIKHIKSFACPLYNTPIRSGILSTTGQSINFIKHIIIPCKQESVFWMKKGIAMILQID